jgi:ubiquinone/menaquinone biosynthesis C-methylase UbiE
MLDVGCGDARYAHDISPDLEYVGADYSINLLNIDRAETDALVCCDSLFLPFSKNTFSIVVSVGMLQHVSQSGKVLDEIASVAKPDALVVINTLRDISLLELLILYPASLIKTEYRASLGERIRYKICSPGKGRRFERYRVKTLTQQLGKLFKREITIKYNGVLGTRLFATEIILFVN